MALPVVLSRPLVARGHLRTLFECGVLFDSPLPSVPPLPSDLEFCLDVIAREGFSIDKWRKNQFSMPTKLAEECSDVQAWLESIRSSMAGWWLAKCTPIDWTPPP